MIGHTFAHYRIEEEIGAGGMGLLYRAHDLTLGRDVALKVLAPAVQADEAARSRLVREARTASALSHPYICTVFEVGEADGRVYIAMELVPGRSLQQMLSDGPLDPASAIRYGGQVAEALAHAHERGVIHRDLKSANVMITPARRAKVLDFGLARRAAPAGSAAAGSIAATLESPVRLTAEGMLVGTPYAIAPEVLRGAEADARSDVWALGVLLHEVVSGRAPFAGETVFELSAAILHQPPMALPHQVSPGLASVIGRCLAKEPSQRYQRASEVHAALEALGSSDRLPSPVEVGAKPAPGRSRAGRALVVGAALWSLGIGALALDLGGLRTRWVGGARSPRIRSLAVLPLANLSKEADQEYFAEGTTEALTTALAQIGALRVISRTSAMRYKGTRRSIGEIARDLGVDAVIEGSVARAGDRVRITAQLIEAATDRHLWAQSYERELKDMLALEDDVARDVARRVQVQIAPATLSRMQTHRPVNPEVYDLYLKGRFHQNRATLEELNLAIKLYEQAMTLDPDDPRPHSGIADAYTLLTEVLNVVPGSEGWPRVREQAKKALVLDPSLADAHASMGAVYFLADLKWGDAEREFRRAIELNPNYSIAHDALGVLLVARGRLDEGLKESRRAVELDPLSLFTGTNLQYVDYFARRYDDAIAQGERVLRLDPGFSRANYVMRMSYAMKGDFRTAARYFDEPLPDSVLAAAKRAIEVRGAPAFWELERRRVVLRRFEEIVPTWAAVVEAQLGNVDHAFALIDRGFAVNPGSMVFLGVDPLFDPLRKDPRFAAALRRAGLPPPS